MERLQLAMELLPSSVEQRLVSGDASVGREVRLQWGMQLAQALAL